MESGVESEGVWMSEEGESGEPAEGVSVVVEGTAEPGVIVEVSIEEGTSVSTGDELGEVVV